MSGEKATGFVWIKNNGDLQYGYDSDDDKCLPFCTRKDAEEDIKEKLQVGESAMIYALKSVVKGVVPQPVWTSPESQS